jgi:hypothetical protein
MAFEQKEGCMTRRLWVLVLFLVVPVTAQAQTSIRVLGTGQLAWDQFCGAVPGTTSCTLADAQGFAYKVHMPATVVAGLTVTVTCSTPVAPATTPLCKTPLAALPLTSSPQSLAVSAAASAADGTQVEQKGTAPFVLSKTALAAAPASSSMVVTP